MVAMGWSRTNFLQIMSLTRYRFSTPLYGGKYWVQTNGADFADQCLNLLANLPYLVELMGFEPMTLCLQGRCSPN